MTDKPYHEVLGCIMWAQVATWPDLSYMANLLSRHQMNPGPTHWKVALHVLSYIKGTLDYKSCIHWALAVECDLSGMLTQITLVTLTPGVQLWVIYS